MHKGHRYTAIIILGVVLLPASPAPGADFHSGFLMGYNGGPSVKIHGGVSSFEIEIELAPDDRVRVGMSADARVEVRRHRKVLLVPNTALVRTEEGAKVRVLHGGNRSELVAIDQGYSDGFQTVALGGLSEGDTVLVRSDGAAP